MVVAVLTQIGAASTTSMAPQLARVSPNMVAVTVVGSCSPLGGELTGTELLSSDKARYGVQLMGRLRSDCEELCEASEDMRGLEDGDGFLSSGLSSFK